MAETLERAKPITVADVRPTGSEHCVTRDALDEGLELNPGPLRSTWVPQPISFETYCRSRANFPAATQAKLLARMTLNIKETFKACNPSFDNSEAFNPLGVLTRPSVGVMNSGLDNEDSDLILRVNGVLVNTNSGCRYIVKGMLGQGTFGQVCKCMKEGTRDFVAVKVIKNQPAYRHQAEVEIGILKMLNERSDPEDKHHIVRLLDFFVHANHLCLVFELLATNLYELLKQNNHRGLSMNLLRFFVKQILESLAVLRESAVIHCDLKPENILLKSCSSGDIKLIDFGSACLEGRTVYSYIQSRFYRSPEVLLGYPYTAAIDMWSLGCVAAELFLGLPLFPGASEYDLLLRMLETLGGQPPDRMLLASKQWYKFFRRSSPTDNSESTTLFTFLTCTEIEARKEARPAIGKDIYKHAKLEDIIMNWTVRDSTSDMNYRESFVHFLRGLVEFDPTQRWSPRQALQHPWLNETYFTRTFQPDPDLGLRQVGGRVWAMQNNSARGHWSGSGLSPQIGSGHVAANAMIISPGHAAAIPYVGSYGSHGSLTGSYGEGGFPLSSSYGSYGENAVHMPAGVATPPSYMGVSLEAQRRFMQIPPISGLHPAGASRSASTVHPMSLGASPTQATPPGSYCQPNLGTSPGSQLDSPGMSPANVSWLNPIGGGGTAPSGLGPGAHRSQGKHHWRSRSTTAAIHPVGSVPSGDALGYATGGVWQGRAGGASVGSAGVFSDSPTAKFGAGAAGSLSLQLPAWRSRIASGAGTGPCSSNNNSHWQPLLATPSADPNAPGSASDGEEASPPPTPADWDPGYSDDLLLQEEADGGTISGPAGVMGSGGARLGPGPGLSSAGLMLPPPAVPAHWTRQDGRMGSGVISASAETLAIPAGMMFTQNGASSLPIPIAAGRQAMAGHLACSQPQPQHEAFQYPSPGYVAQASAVYTMLPYASTNAATAAALAPLPDQQEQQLYRYMTAALVPQPLPTGFGAGQEYALRASVPMAGAAYGSPETSASVGAAAAWPGNASPCYGPSPPSHSMDAMLGQPWLMASASQGLGMEGRRPARVQWNASLTPGTHRRSVSQGMEVLSNLAMESGTNVVQQGQVGRSETRRFS